MGFWESLFFWIFAFGAVLSSVAVVAMRNPLYSALALVLDFFFFAGLYGLLSAHLMAITQVLVYAGAIMVLFLFIIMLLNLRDDELGQFEFRIHHLISAGAIGGLLFFVATAITPLVDMDKVSADREEQAKAYEASLKTYENNLAQVEGETDEKVKAEKLKKLEASKPAMTLQSRTAIKGPLYADLNESGLERVWQERLARHESGQTAINQGKWSRFDKSTPMVLPESLSGDDRASFGTIEPMSILIVNRFVVPFELTALLLLAAIVGAVIIAKRRL